MCTFKWLPGIIVLLALWTIIALTGFEKPVLSSTAKTLPSLSDPTVEDWLYQHYPFIRRPYEHDSDFGSTTDRLPSQFSTYTLLNAQNFIRDQGTASTCWAFAANTLMEIAIVKDFSETYDFSEIHLIENTPIPATEKSGGHFLMSWIYYLNRLGPVTEAGELSPYQATGYMEINNDIHAIKRAIQSRGAVLSSIYLNEKDASVFNKKTASYYNPSSEKLRSHELVLVGWDDDYSKTLFSTHPQKDGAFIAQNSFGTGWGEQGLFYISYEDVHIKGHVFALEALLPANLDETIYYRDETGLTHFESIEESLAPTAILPFTSSREGVLKKFSLYTGTTPLTLEVFWGQGVFDGELGPMKYRFDQISKGYQTFDLPLGLSVLSEEPYWIAVRFKGDKKFIIPIEAPYPEIEYTITGQPNEGYLMGSKMPVDLFTLRNNASLAIRLVFE